LLTAREPVYALADITLESRDTPHEMVVDAAIAAVAEHLGITP
jgi:hypothetical protein